MGKFEDLSKLKFGTLIAIERSDDKIYYYNSKPLIKVMYKCICDCGQEILKSAEYLKKKKIPSCSAQCRRKTISSLIGNKVNKLTVISGPFTKNKEGSIYWSCACDCGNKLDVTNSRLLNYKAISCGPCASRSILKKINELKIPPHNKLPPEEASFNALYKRYKINANNKEISFDLSKEEFKILTKRNCFYCEDMPKRQHPSKKSVHKMNEKGKNVNGIYLYNGIDRVDNNKGYVLDNCVSCCVDCNYIKSDWNIDQLKDHLTKMMRKLKILW